MCEVTTMRGLVRATLVLALLVGCGARSGAETTGAPAVEGGHEAVIPLDEARAFIAHLVDAAEIAKDYMMAPLLAATCVESPGCAGTCEAALREYQIDAPTIRELRLIKGCAIEREVLGDPANGAHDMLPGELEHRVLAYLRRRVGAYADRVRRVVRPDDQRRLDTARATLGL
jgi:hypothetical protein